MDIFTGIYFVVLVIEMIIRVPLNKKRKQEKMSEQRVTSQEKTLLGLLSLGGFLIPAYLRGNELAGFCQLHAARLGRLAGCPARGGAVFIFWRGHADLGLNWSPTLEIREKHELITRGIYGVIRHPMYASQWLLVIAQPLLLQNWIAGFLNLLVFIPFYFLRVKAEEQMMLDSFGAQYQEYMKKTGGVLPKM